MGQEENSLEIATPDYLEPIVAENYNSEYLNILKDDIFEKCECYKKDYEKWKRKKKPLTY